MKAINPAAGVLIKDYEEHTAENVREAIERAHMTFVDWRHTAFSHRGELMKGCLSRIFHPTRKGRGVG